MSDDVRDHWTQVWAETEPDEVSWFQAEPTTSLDLIADLDLSPEARILDVGGGASRLVDHLLARGYANATVLDVAQPALERARQRLGEAAEQVTWVVADVLAAELPDEVELWHDRAVFHFLTDPADRARYAEQVAASLAPGGHAIVATFSPEGPERCSGLPVRRYDAQAIADEVGEAFALVDTRREEHTTPWDAVQSFQYAVLERRA